MDQSEEAVELVILHHPVVLVIVVVIVVVFVVVIVTVNEETQGQVVQERNSLSETFVSSFLNFSYLIAFTGKILKTCLEILGESLELTSWKMKRVGQGVAV